MARAVLGVAAVALAVGMAGLAPMGSHAQENGTPAAPLPAVTIVEASLEALTQSARFSGRLDADRRVDLVPRVNGTLLEVAFAAGELVEEGQVLYRIEPDLYQASLREADGALRSAQAQRDLAEIERDRQRELVSRDAAPQANLDNAEAALGRAEGELIRAEAALQAAEINLSYTEITAPYTGRIGPTQIDAGALVDPSVGRLATLIALDPIHVEFQIPTAVMRNFAEAIEAGTASSESSVYLELANGSVYSEPGDIDFVDAEIDAGTDSVTLRARFKNPDGKLLDQELVRVELRSSDEVETLAVPQEAIQRDVQGAFVLVVGADSTVEARRVVAGATLQGFSVISQGLDEGDQVIVEGANKVRPGQEVDAALAGDG